MRRRSTFFHAPEVDVDPSQLQLSDTRFFITDLNAAREERLTFGLSELPAELVAVLEASHELHLHWATESKYNTSSPLFARISPGLHVSYTPLNAQQDVNEDRLCPLLQRMLSPDLKCLSPSQTFTHPWLISSRFAATPSLHYYSRLKSLTRLIAYLQTQVCSASSSAGDADAEKACLHNTSLISLATTLSVDYDSISHALVLTITWATPPAIFFDPISGDIYYDAWQAKIDAASPSSSPSSPINAIEVGILTTTPASDAHELSLSGVLTVVGEDTTPQATLFSFPSRHHPAPDSQTYTITFDAPTGLHPTMRISFPPSASPSSPSSTDKLAPPASKPKDSTCALHAYLTLPSAVFPDPYQLGTSDALFLASHGLVTARAIAGEVDLEAPAYAVEKWGSNVLLELDTSAAAAASDSVSGGSEGRARTQQDVTIPLHLRYLAPSSNGSDAVSVEVPWPVLFWACTAEEGTRFPVNPFDRVNLGYDGLFGARTMFYHLHPSVQQGRQGKEVGEGRLISQISVPVLSLGGDGGGGAGRWLVESGTVGVVLLGWLWVVWRVVLGLKIGELGGGGGGGKKVKAKKT